MNKEKKKTSLLLTIGAAGLLIGGGVAAYWALTEGKWLLREIPVGTNIIPQDALLAISVSTNTGQWQQLREFGTPQTQAELDKIGSQLRDRFLTSNGYNYEQDIQPWVGKEVTIAFLPPQLNTPTKNSTQAPPADASNQREAVVVVLPIANPARAQQVLENPKPLKQGKWIDRTYKGVQIKETQGVPTQNYSAAVLNQRFLVVTDNPKATERAIDAYEGGASLATTDGYTKALSKIDAPQPFAQLYVNVPVAAKVAAANPRRPVSPQGLAQLQQNQGLATTVSLQPEGLQFKSISWLKQNSDRVHTVENRAGRMQSRVPAETLMMVSGGDLQRLWTDYARGAQSNPLTPVPPQSLRAGVKSITGLDLDEDWLKWMDGEFSLSIVPATPKDGSPNDMALSLVFMVQASDRALAEKSLEQLDQVMSGQYQFKLQEAKVGGKTVVNWIAPYGAVTATHGWLDGNVAFLALGAPVTNEFLPQPATTLASTERFQKTVPSDLKPNNGQFFLDVERTTKIFPLPQLSPNQQMLMEAVRSIGITTAVSDERSIRYNIFVSLKKAGSASASPKASP